MKTKPLLTQEQKDIILSKPKWGTGRLSRFLNVPQQAVNFYRWKEKKRQEKLQYSEKFIRMDLCPITGFKLREYYD